jgi:hypothetical protein
MLTDPFCDDWLNMLHQRFRERPAGHALQVLIDGAFVPGLHRRIGVDRKALLFEGLPASGPGTLDVSPFIVPFDPEDPALRAVLRRCQGWPMVSVIESPEPWPELAARLAAWCIVENDGQRFNFRFADTRRLPAVLRTLDETQRGQLTGSAVSWSYIGRDGRWETLALNVSAGTIVSDPQLDDAQFAALVEDSRADEVLARLDDHPARAAHRPSQCHALITLALAVVLEAGIGDTELVEWCGWLLAHARRDDEPDIARLFTAWKAHALLMEAADATET